MESGEIKKLPSNINARIKIKNLLHCNTHSDDFYMELLNNGASSSLSFNMEGKVPQVVSQISTSINNKDIRNGDNPKISVVNIKDFSFGKSSALISPPILNHQCSDSPESKGLPTLHMPDIVETKCEQDIAIHQNKLTEFDHSYSHSMDIDKLHLNLTSGSSPPQIFSGSPHFSSNSLKNSPDILMHNDKINILKRMSQVFNGERKVENDANCIFSNIFSCEENQKYKLNGSNVALETNSVSNFKNNESYNTPLVSKCKHLSIENYGEYVSENYACFDDQKSFRRIEVTKPSVHYVSSYDLKDDMNIKVESYIGKQGEHVDVVEGFTFFSFLSEDEMVKYNPKNNTCKVGKSRLRRKKKRKGISRRKINSSKANGESLLSSEIENKFPIVLPKEISCIDDIAEGKENSSLPSLMT